MTDTHDTAIEATEQETASRGKPSPAREAKPQRWLLFSFLIIAGLLMAFLTISSEVKRSANKHKEKNTLVAVRSNPGKPYIAPHAPQEVAHQAVQPICDAACQLQKQHVMMQQRRLEEQLNSPQLIVFDTPYNTSGISGAHNDNSPYGQAPYGAGEDDPNANFASRYGGSIPKPKQAFLMDNLDSTIAQGTMIAGIMETAISSNLLGFTRAVVAEDIYSMEGDSILIPKGSRLIGRYRSAVVHGQSRVFIVWTRLITMEGISIALDSYGTDNLGRSGIEGDVDTHFFERFGSSIMLSMIDAGLAAAVEAADDNDSATVAIDAGGNDFSRAAELALENSINIPPTIHIDQGARIKIFLGQDLDFTPVYAQAYSAL